ncbi:metallophosphoesterase [Microlunatus parietis]|uniref:Putative MPP superfamily phosphohydrolase n=1 Tax=Microlunatus parietis TaxID=682979 RepID=A0A7Y9I7M7_9ACTN|nr:metallophosphoesterase [Microlunatus parietis]NYE71667.1 putative MPP superfamily phosphohydrolase [Microlunatus parietis]
MSAGRVAKIAAGTVLGVGAVGAGCLAYAAGYEVRSFRLRRYEVPVLPPDAVPIRILHLSDLHLTPGQRKKQEWVNRLAGLEPDLVIDTGDNLAHVDAVEPTIRALGRLLDLPGVYVWGSNDYFRPTFKNPLRYLTQPRRTAKPSDNTLPWQDLGRAFKQSGWLDLTHTRATIEIHGVRIGFRGTDDAHLGADRYAEVAGPIDRSEVDVAIAVTHAPYLRLLDAMTADGHDLIVAGHTHGGQVCVPFYGALVTNCDIDAARVKGLSSHRIGDQSAFLHVSAGLGTSPYAPIRFACPPEATLLTLVPRDAE